MKDTENTEPQKPFNDHTPVGKWFCKVNYPMYGSMGAFKIEVPEEPFGLVIAERGPFDARSDEMKANAEFIVHACNNWYATVAMLRKVAKSLEHANDALDEGGFGEEVDEAMAFLKTISS